jgi:hypothetical protein
MKRCARCKRFKSLSHFYRDKKGRNGRSSYCKPCACAKTRAWLRVPENRTRATKTNNAWRKANPEKQRAASRRASRSPARRKQTQRYRRRHTEKAQAHWTVSNALRSGRLTRRPCAKCGTTKRVHAHHEDYSKPLDVVWLCHRHHDEIHQKKRTTGN